MENLFEEQQLHVIISNLELEFRKRWIISNLLLRAGRISKRRFSTLFRVYGPALLALESYHRLLAFLASSSLELPRIRVYNDATLKAISDNLEQELKRQMYIWRILVRSGRMTRRQCAEKMRIYKQAITAVQNYGAFLSFLL